MQLNRLRRVARARWWVVVLASVLGAVAGLGFTNFSNENIERSYAATGSITFIPAPSDEPAQPSNSGGRGGGGSADPAAAALVNTAIDVAKEVNADLLNEPGAQIEAVPEEGRIDFRAAAPSEAAALSVVEEMRRNYVEVDPTGIDAEAEMERVVARSTEISERLESFEPPPEPEPVEPNEVQQARIDILGQRRNTTINQVSILQDEINGLDPEDDAGEIAEKQAEIAEIQKQILDFDREIARLTPDQPEVEPFELSPRDELERTALEGELAQLATRYTELQELAATGGDTIALAEIEVVDLTPGQRSPGLTAIIGLIAGAGLGLVALVLLDRAQGRVWVPADMGAMPFLAEVPQRSGVARRRYRQARQQGVQSIRSALLGMSQAGGSQTIGFTSLGAGEDAVSGLVLEVGRSLAAVGRKVLIVDGQIGAVPSLRSEVAGGSTLADIAVRHSDEAVDVAQLGDILDRTFKAAPNLSVLPGDPRTADPVDVLSSRAFHELARIAGDRFDFVIIVGPSALSPFAYAMTGLVSAHVVVAAMGRTREEQVEKLARQLAGGPSRLVGGVLLGVKARRGLVTAADLVSPVPVQEGVATAGQPKVNGDAPAPTGLLDRLGESLASLARDPGDPRDN